MQNHLNYFHPFTKSTERASENDLTRAFLSVLRFVPVAQAMFIELIREEQRSHNSEHVLPAFTSREGGLMNEIKTQTGKLPSDCSVLVSLFIADEIPQTAYNHKVKASTRIPVYDGVILYGEDYCLILENKLKQSDFREEQLDPNIEDTPDIEIDPQPVVLRWGDIVERLNSFLAKSVVGGAEYQIIADFIEFMDTHVSYLNPYTSFVICNDDKWLLNKRCGGVLQEIVGPGVLKKAEWHYILLNVPSIWQLYLSVQSGIIEKDLWSIRLGLYPADTIGQAREFYKNIDIDRMVQISENDSWDVRSNLHFSHMQKHLVWTQGILPFRDYLQYWKQNPGEMKKVIRDPNTGFSEIFNSLLDIGLISREDLPALSQYFDETNRSSVNIVPGVRIWYHWNMDEAISLDNQGNFTQAVIDRTTEALTCWGEQFNPKM